MLIIIMQLVLIYVPGVSYTYFFLFVLFRSVIVLWPLLSRSFDISLRHTKLGSNPPSYWPVRRWNIYLTTHKGHKRQASMLSVGFEHSKRLAQSYIFDLAVSAFDTSIVYQLELAIRRMKYLGIVSSPLCV